jgi:hypothetical protein
MAGVLKLLRGDLFDGPSDLIVIPCTTAGALKATALMAPTNRRHGSSAAHAIRAMISP